MCLCNVVNPIISIYNLFLYGLYAYDFYEILICTGTESVSFNSIIPLLSPLRCWTKAEESGAHARGTPPHHAQRFLEGGTCQKSRIHSGMVGAMVAWETFFFPTIFVPYYSRPWQLAELGHAMHHVMFRHGWLGGIWRQNGRMLHLEVEGCFLPWTLHTAGLWMSWLADHFCILYVNWPKNADLIERLQLQSVCSHPNAPKSLFSYQLWRCFFHRWMTISSLTRSRDMCHQHFVFFYRHFIWLRRTTLTHGEYRTPPQRCAFSAANANGPSKATKFQALLGCDEGADHFRWEKSETNSKLIQGLKLHNSECVSSFWQLTALLMFWASMSPSAFWTFLRFLPLQPRNYIAKVGETLGNSTTQEPKVQDRSKLPQVWSEFERSKSWCFLGRCNHFWPKFWMTFAFFR